MLVLFLSAVALRSKSFNQLMTFHGNEDLMMENQPNGRSTTRRTAVGRDRIVDPCLDSRCEDVLLACRF